MEQATRFDEAVQTQAALPEGLACQPALRSAVLHLQLAPRSVYPLRGAARWAWRHGVPPVAAQRAAITFRALKHPGGTRTRRR